MAAGMALWFIPGPSWLRQYGPAGDCVLHAWRLDALQGTLKDKINEVRAMNSESMESTAAFSWRFDSCPESPKGLGQVVLIPPGYIVARVSANFVAVTRGFGISKDGLNCDFVHEVLTDLFKSFPTLKSGSYEVFEKHVRSRRSKF